MEIKFGGSDDGNSCYNSSLSTFNHSLNVGGGALVNYRQRGDINVGGSLDMATKALVAREIEKMKIKEEIKGYGYLKRWEIEEEAIKELISESEVAMRQAAGVSFVNSALYSLQSSLCGLIANRRDTVALHEKMALVNRLNGGGVNAVTSRANRRWEGGIDGRMLREIHGHGEDVIDGLLPLGNRFDDLVDGRLSMVNRPNERISDDLPFQRQPGVMCGAVSKPVINLREAVAPVSMAAVPAKSNALAGSKRKLESQSGWTCELCQLAVTSEQQAKEHLNGKKHKAKEIAMQRRAKKSKWIPSTKPDSLTEDTEKSSEPTIPSVTTSPNSSNIKYGNQHRRHVEASSPEQPHVDSRRGTGKEKKQKTEKNSNYKFWCQLCEVGTNSEELLTVHRSGKKHTKLLMEKGGGVIAIKNMSDDGQYAGLDQDISAIKGMEDSHGNADGNGGAVCRR